MNEIQIFSNESFGEVRTVEIKGKPFFVANDVAKALGYIETAKAIRTHCKGVSEMDIPTAGGIQTVKIIPEGDIYRLIVRSNLPSAEKFESWVFDEVIPSIRETGGYKLPKTYTEALESLLLEVKENERLVNENETFKAEREVLLPKADFFDAVTDSKTAIPVGDVAKVLGMGIGRNKLFEFLRDEKILTYDNRPYQKYIDQGYFRVVEQKYEKNGEVCINIKTLVFQKGIDFIRKKLEKCHD